MEKNETITSVNDIGKIISTASKSKSSRLVMAGDFNLKGIDWENDHVVDNQPYLRDFINVIHENFLYQHVMNPTRHRLGEVSNILDLVFSNEEGLISPIEHCSGLGKSDHDCLLFNIICSKEHLCNNSERPNVFKANFMKIERNLEQVDWESLLTGDVSVAYKRFCKEIDIATKGNIPMSKGVSKNKRNLFMTKEALKLRNLKNKQWKRYLERKDPLDFNKFKLSRDKLRETTRRLRKELEVKLTEDIKKKPKPFWKYVSSRLRTRLNIPTLILPNDEKATSSLHQAEALNKYFSSVFTEENTNDIPSVPINYHGTLLSMIMFTAESVKNKLLQLNDNKSPGPDQMHPYLVKRLVNVLCTPIAIIFNLSMTSGKTARQWNEAILTAIYKKGARNLVENYRPISLTSIIGKLMESFIRDAMLTHMIENNLFTNDQHGFVPKRNCATQLLEAIETWYDITEDMGYIDVIYTDFAKAFDAVPHKRLIKKVEAYGFSDNLLSWIKSFLSNRISNRISNS